MALRGIAMQTNQRIRLGLPEIFQTFDYSACLRTKPLPDLHLDLR